MLASSEIADHLANHTRQEALTEKYCSVRDVILVIVADVMCWNSVYSVPYRSILLGSISYQQEMLTAKLRNKKKHKLFIYAFA